MRGRIPLWLIASVVLTALFSLWSISYRYRVEQHNKAVSIALEYETIEAYAASQGTSVDNALLALKRQGLGSVVLSEEYVADLVNVGQVSITAEGISGNSPRIARAMATRFPGMKPTVVSAGRGGDMPSQLVYGAGLSAATLRGVAVGLNPAQAQSIRNAGLIIVARLANPPGVSADYVRGTLSWAHELGASVYLPVGDQVLGRREALKDMADEITKLRMLYASPEFAKIGGDDNVLKMAPEQVVRLHSAQAAELDKLRPDGAIERYSLAARERGMRILLLRPLSYASATPIASLGGFVRDVARDCVRQGLAMGEAHPFDDSKVPTWLFLLIGLSTVPAAYYAGAAFIKSKAWRIAGLVLALAIGALAVANHGRPYTALLAAIAFPTVAFLLLDALAWNTVRTPYRTVYRPTWLLLIGGFLGASLVSLVGGLAVAGLLNGLPYFIRAEQFEGVKLAVFLPIALVALYFLMKGIDLKGAMRNPMTWGAAILALIILGALAFMSSRTGNDNPAGVSDLELKMRFVLDQVLMVRPRTKEFLVGHPLMIIGVGLLLFSRRRDAATRDGHGEAAKNETEESAQSPSPGSPRFALWAALALAGGAIGQTDIVNTMCHIHTPVVLSLMRIGVGMVAGCIIGLAVWTLVRRGLPAGEP